MLVVDVSGSSVLGRVVVLGTVGSRGRFEVAFSLVAPLLVDFSVERDFLHEEGGEESETGDGDAYSPCVARNRGKKRR